MSGLQRVILEGPAGRRVARFASSKDGLVAVVFDSGELEIFRLDNLSTQQRVSPSHVVPGPAEWSDCCWTDADSLVAVSLTTGRAVHADGRKNFATQKISLCNLASTRFSRIFSDRANKLILATSRELVSLLPDDDGCHQVGSAISFSPHREEYVIDASAHPNGCTVALCCAPAILIVATAPDVTGLHSQIAQPHDGPPAILRSITHADETPIACSWSKYGDLLAYATNRSPEIFLWNVAMGQVETLVIGPRSLIVRSLRFGSEERLVVATDSDGVLSVNVDDGSFRCRDSSGESTKCPCIGTSATGVPITAPIGLHPELHFHCDRIN